MYKNNTNNNNNNIIEKDQLKNKDQLKEEQIQEEITTLKEAMNKWGRPVKYSDPEEMIKIMIPYAEHCKKYKKPLTLSGLALRLGIDRRTLLEYSKKPEFSPTIKAFKRAIEAQLEEKLESKESSTAGLIFNLKNNFWRTDRIEIDQTVKQFNLWDLHHWGEIVEGEIVVEN